MEPEHSLIPTEQIQVEIAIRLASERTPRWNVVGSSSPSNTTPAEAGGVG